MIKSKSKYLIIFLIIGLFAANFASADLVNCGGPGDSPKGCQISDLIFTIERIINFLLAWAWLVSMLFILWSAWGFINSGGNQEEISIAKATLRNALIGFFLIMAAYLLVNLIVGLLSGQGNPREGAFDIYRHLLPRP